MRPRSFLVNAVVAAVAAALLLACTPALDWRQVRPEGTALEALFPCKPARQTRRVALAGTWVEMSLWSCAAGGSTYAVGAADVGDPARVGAALAELKQALQAHVQGAAGLRKPAAVAGMTPNERADQLILQGRLPDGRPVRLEAAFFAHATWVYQASIVDDRPDPEAAEAFFSGLHLLS